MKIEVTQEDIDQGKRGLSFGCPIALAIKRTLGEGNYISVAKSIKINGEHIHISNRVTNFIHKFDMNQKIEPFSFELDI